MTGFNDRDFTPKRPGGREDANAPLEIVTIYRTFETNYAPRSEKIGMKTTRPGVVWISTPLSIITTTVFENRLNATGICAIGLLAKRVGDEFTASKQTYLTFFFNKQNIHQTPMGEPMGQSSRAQLSRKSYSNIPIKISPPKPRCSTVVHSNQNRSNPLVSQKVAETFYKRNSTLVFKIVIEIIK